MDIGHGVMKNIFTKSDHDPTLNFQQDNALKIEQLPVKRCSKIEQNSCLVDFTNSDWILKWLLNSTWQGVSARDYILLVEIKLPIRKGNMYFH